MRREGHHGIHTAADDEKVKEFKAHA